MNGEGERCSGRGENGDKDPCESGGDGLVRRDDALALENESAPAAEMKVAYTLARVVSNQRTGQRTRSTLGLHLFNR